MHCPPNRPKKYTFIPIGMKVLFFCHAYRIGGHEVGIGLSEFRAGGFISSERDCFVPLAMTEPELRAVFMDNPG